MEGILEDRTRQTAKNINVIMKTPSRERFAAFLQTPMGKHFVRTCHQVIPLAAPCFPTACLNSESGQFEVADSTLQFAYTADCWREVKMMPATVGATISQRNAAHQALLLNKHMACLVIEEDMNFVEDAPEKFDIAVSLLQGHWHEHMMISLTHGESASHSALVGGCPTIFGDQLQRLNLKSIPMRSTDVNRPHIRWAGIGTRCVLYTPKGLHAVMEHKFSMRASDVDLVQSLLKQGFRLGQRLPALVFFPSIGVHSVDFTDFFRGSGVKKSNMGGHAQEPYIVVNTSSLGDVLDRLELLAVGLWIGQVCQVGVVVIWPKDGQCKSLFPESFLIKDTWKELGILFIKFIHHDNSGTTKHYQKHPLCLGQLSGPMSYRGFSSIWNGAVTKAKAHESLLITAHDSGPYALIDLQPHIYDLAAQHLKHMLGETTYTRAMQQGKIPIVVDFCTSSMYMNEVWNDLVSMRKCSHQQATNMCQELHLSLRKATWNCASSAGSFVLLVGNCYEPLWYAKQHMSTALSSNPPTLLVSTYTPHEAATVRMPHDLSMFESNDWTANIPTNGSDESLMELAWRATAVKYVTHEGNKFSTWREHHGHANFLCDDMSLGPMVSWSQDNINNWPGTGWWQQTCTTLIPLTRKINEQFHKREIIKGSNLTPLHTKALDDLGESPLSWASEQVEYLLLTGNNEVDGAVVGRALRADTAQYGVTLKDSYTRFQEASKAINETAPARQAWSWLKTLVLYKLNPRRVAKQMPELALIHTPSGAAITVVSAAVGPPEQEDADTAPPQTGPPSRKRPSEFVAAAAPRRRAIGGDTPSQASSASGPLPTLGSRSKAPGCPPATGE